MAGPATAGPAIALAMIVKDEAASLGRCLASVREAVDELIVVDTGSQDRTAEIAEGFGARLLRLAWPGDFAAARQFAFDQASAEWVLWLDADDVVEGAGHIRPALAAAGGQVAGFSWRYIAAEDRHGNIACEFWRERCVRRDRAFRWQGCVHEVLTGPAADRLARDDAVHVVHRPPPGRRRDPRRNLAILQAEHARLGARTPARSLLYLGLEHLALGELAPAERFLRRFLGVCSWAEQGYAARLALADLLRRQGRLAEAEMMALDARALLPRRAEAAFSLAETSYCRGDWPAVARWAEAGQGAGPCEGGWLSHPLDLAYRWIIHYVHALYHLGRLGEAAAWTERALAICPDDPWHLTNRTFFRDRLAAAAPEG
jgi:hypothetical protein